MAYDIAPLKSYVRFYLAIVSQLERVWQSVVAIEGALRDELGPFAADLGPVASSAVTTLTDPVRPVPSELGELWKPVDEEELEGLTDVYEVVGRFTFQGNEDANLARIEALVAAGEEASRENGEALAALEPLSELAAKTALALREAEVKRAAIDRMDRETKLEPLVETILLRAKQTMDALLAVPLPSLEDPATAAEDYKKLRAKFQHVYQTCLPFLKNAIDKLWSFVNAAVPQSFPEELPLVPELPPELLTLTGVGSEEVEKAERTLASLAEETIQLKKAKEELAAKLVKLEADLAATAAKRDESQGDADFAHTLLDWARTTEQLESHRKRAGEAEAELEARVGATSRQEHDAVDRSNAIDANEKVLKEKLGSAEGLSKELEELKKKEPLLFGKDDWRARVAELQGRVDAENLEVANLAQAFAQGKMELSAAMVRVHTAQAEQAIAERSLADLRNRITEAERALRALGEKLGSKKPTRPVPPDEVEEIALAVEKQMASVDGKIEELRTQQRKLKDDGLKMLSRERQIDVERQNAQARVEGARVARAEGIDAAHKRLAVERKGAVEEHVREVLGALSKSLGQVGTVFVDPARERVKELTEPNHAIAEKVESAGVRVAPVVKRLLAERVPEILSVKELLHRIRVEFCEAAPAACRTAWGSGVSPAGS
ncbi:MAG: hypothetical protein U0414_36725 [Polyangiaceae bacterium]